MSLETSLSRKDEDPETQGDQACNNKDTGTSSSDDENREYESEGGCDEAIQTLKSLQSRYPFNIEQLKILTTINELWKEDDDFHFIDIFSSEPKSFVGLKWIKGNIRSIHSLSTYLKTFSKYNNIKDVYEIAAELTARQGSLSSPLYNIYNVVYDQIESDVQAKENKIVSVTAEKLCQLMYHMALATHILYHSEDSSKEIDNDYQIIQSIITRQQSPLEMIKSLAEFQQSVNDAKSSSSVDSSFHFEPVKVDLSIHIQAETFLDWSEVHFPHLHSIPTTFFHLALFSHLDCREEYNDHSTAQAIHDSEDHHDIDHKRKTIPDNILSVYALGKRKPFQFPSLAKLIMSNTLNQRSILGQMSTDSYFLSTNLTSKDPSTNVSLTTTAFSLAVMDDDLSNKWHKLYSTEDDGFAFLNLQRSLIGYTGPTIMLIRPTDANSKYSDHGEGESTPGLLGFYTANPWKEEGQFYGTSDCFLFRIEPSMKSYRPRTFAQSWSFHTDLDGRNKTPGLNASMTLPLNRIKENYMYFHPSAGHFHAGRNGGIYSGIGSQKARLGAKPNGIIIGGTEQDPRLHLTESLERCIASSGGPRDATFESGPLLPGQWDKFFNVDVIEVWGVGGDEKVYQAIHDKEKQEDIRNAVRKRVQQVDKKQFLDDFQSGLHVSKGRGSNALYQHRFDSARFDFEANHDDDETGHEVQRL